MVSSVLKETHYLLHQPGGPVLKMIKKNHIINCEVWSPYPVLLSTLCYGLLGLIFGPA